LARQTFNQVKLKGLRAKTFGFDVVKGFAASCLLRQPKAGKAMLRDDWLLGNFQFTSILLCRCW
jgi:hypothetical protein